MTRTTQEQWKPITRYNEFEFEGNYEISSWGNIRNRETKKHSLHTVTEAETDT